VPTEEEKEAIIEALSGSAAFGDSSLPIEDRFNRLARFLSPTLVANKTREAISSAGSQASEILSELLNQPNRGGRFTGTEISSAGSQPIKEALAQNIDVQVEREVDELAARDRAKEAREGLITLDRIRAALEAQDTGSAERILRLGPDTELDENVGRGRFSRFSQDLIDERLGVPDKVSERELFDLQRQELATKVLDTGTASLDFADALAAQLSQPSNRQVPEQGEDSLERLADRFDESLGIEDPRDKLRRLFETVADGSFEERDLRDLIKAIRGGVLGKGQQNEERLDALEELLEQFEPSFKERFVNILRATIPGLNIIPGFETPQGG